ncbi:MAG: DNA topoisomerase I [Candidatus Woesearchaeota archaeon]
MVQLIICEKPSSAKKIAEALADKKPEKFVESRVTHYELTHNKNRIIVASAVGHLFALAEKEKKGWTYPVFDIEWKAAYEVRKSADFTKKYYDVLKNLSKQADTFIVATDFDIEGEVIGLNVVRYICKKKDAKRMKFSTLTKDELIESYKTAQKHLDWGQANSGETRHFLDFFYGINLSRALSLSIKAAGSFKIMSTGRVQGPSLNLLAEREKEIRKFISEPFWQIELQTDKLNAQHKKDKFWDKKQAKEIVKKTTGKKAFVKDLRSSTKSHSPPTPFDLTSLQLEAYRHFSISPKQTLSLAQNLYTKGYISYPRTSSQKLPVSLNFKKIFSKLSKQAKYSNLILKLPEKLTPNEGKKSDSAHPAIYPTGEIGKLTEYDSKLYDLIVHRFIATFGTPAKRETSTVEIDVNKEIFSVSGTRTTEPGWHVFYGKYAKFEEQELPKLKIGQELENKKINLHEKETQPPKRFNSASIIKELEKRNLGTKATRAQIVDSLFQRHYIQEKAIEVTDLGLKTNETLKKYVPQILDENLTRHFEIELEKIREGKKQPETVLEEAKTILTKLLKDFKAKEEKIGQALLEANRETQAQASLIGKCPNCKDGLLNLRRGKFGQFCACDQYPNCKTTFSVPNKALVRATKKECSHCQHPMISTIQSGRRPREICLNPQCKSKQVDKSLLDQKKKCPNCGKELIVKKGVYGAFFACPGYPKCKHIENINGNNKQIKTVTTKP